MAASRPVNVACALITLPPVDADAIRRLSSWGQKKCCLFRVIDMGTEQLLLLRYRYKAQKKTATSVLWNAVRCKLPEVGDPCVRVLTEDEFEERWQETSSTLQPEATDVEAGAPGVQPRSPPVARVPEDLSAALTQMTDADVSRIRKTKESPPKVSVYDVFQCLFGIDPRNTSRTFARLLESHREELHDEGRPLWTTFKFDGQGQQDTPVADARGIVRIIMLLPCRAAAPVRAKAAYVLVRYLGGAPSLMPEIAQDSLPQAQAPDAEDALGHGNPSVTEPRYELLTASLGGDKRQPHTEQVVFVDDFRADLSRLLKKEPGQLGRVRKVEGSPPQYSLIDVIVCITGQAAPDAAKILRRVVEGDKDIRELIPHVNLVDSLGRRHQATSPVADIQTVLRVIMQLPCRGLGPLKGEICEVFSRFMGQGNLSVTEPRVLHSEPSPMALEDDVAPTDALAHLTDADVSLIRETSPAPRAAEAAHLCALLGVKEAVRVRTVGEGAEKRFSLVDVARLVSAKTAQNALRDVRLVMGEFSSVAQLVSNFQFEGAGQRETPVGDLRTALLVVLRLRSRVAQRLSANMVDLFVRFVGGDPELAKATMANREFQEHLSEKQPDHPLRVYGETVEQESRVPPPPQEFNESPHLEGGVHLYALGSRAHPRLFKTGSGKDPWVRLQSEERKHKGSLQLSVVAIWWHEGHLEHLARRYLLEMPTDELAIQGTEYRMTSLREIKDATDAARLQHRALTNTGVQADEETEAQCKRRRLCLQVCREEFELEKEKRDYELEMSEKELGIEEKRFDLEKRKSSYRNGARNESGS